MMEKKKKRIAWLAISVLFVSGLFLGLNSAKASVACHRYSEYRREFHNDNDKEDFFKVKWLESHDNGLYMFYKSFCGAHKFDSKAEFSKLSIKNQKACHEYFAHESYENYIYYRDKCRSEDDENVTSDPPSDSDQDDDQPPSDGPM